MRKFFFCVLAAVCIGTGIWCGSVIRDRQTLNGELIRLHVIANSDSEEDQRIKLLVRDAIIGQLPQAESVRQAREYLQEHLSQLEACANEVLQANGCTETAQVTLGKESYPVREYDTFSLPSGVYESLRVVIGDGNGQNWWCVAFPALCMGATSEDAAEVAVGSGFSEELTDTLTAQDGYEIRFFLLDLLGRIEKFFS